MNNYLRVRNLVFIALLGCIVTLGDTTTQNIVLLYPNQAQDSTSYDPGKIVLVSMVKDSAVSELRVATQWEQTRYFDFRDQEIKESFPREFVKLFPPKATLQKIWYTFKFQNQYSTPESVQYRYTDTVSVRMFYSSPEFLKLAKYVQGDRGEFLLLTVRGWKDSSYTTQFDDPTADTRSMYKLQLRLIPGLNTLYFSAADKAHALEYTTTLSNESKALDSRDGRFHLSALEANCTTCHEGLPSADSGKSNKAECATCHKAIAMGTGVIHAPVEMKECGSCHEWSAEKKSMIVANGVPDKCFECHTEKKAWIDSATTQHPVATDCTGCHVPHSTDQPHLLKTNIYDLCTGCHTDKKYNHPVGKHPLRFKTLANGEEISCVSCHNPHGSKNEHLLTVEGGPMAVCAKCHQ